MRLRIIAPLLKYRRGSTWFGVHQDGVRFAVYSKEELAWYLSWRWGVSRSVIWGWYSKFLKGASACRCSPRKNDCAPCGLAALRDEPRADKGESRWFGDHPAAADVVLRALSERRSIRLIHQALQLALPKAPSYETVRCFVGALRLGVQR